VRGEELMREAGQGRRAAAARRAAWRRQTVTAAAQWPRLDPSWWRHFTADFTATMVSSTRPVRQAA
jgi:hypothetical protein